MSVTAGAYGLQVSGRPMEGLHVDGGEDWTPLEVRVHRGAPPVLHGVGTRAAAFGLLGGGWATLDRDAGVAVRGSDGPVDPTSLVHPFLAAAGAVHASWAGRAALHAGAVVLGDRGWLVAAPSGGGKSSTLAALAQRGAAVLTDDLAVVDAGEGGHAVLAGPRSIDLRPDAARLLDAPAPAVRDGTRRRLALPTAAARTPIAGVVHLAWDDALRTPVARTVAPGDRLRLLLRDDLWSMAAPSPETPLALADLPAVHLRRPRGSASLAATVELLLGLG